MRNIDTYISIFKTRRKKSFKIKIAHKLQMFYIKR